MNCFPGHDFNGSQWREKQFSPSFFDFEGKSAYLFHWRQNTSLRQHSLSPATNCEAFNPVCSPFLLATAAVNLPMRLTRWHKQGHLFVTSERARGILTTTGQSVVSTTRLFGFLRRQRLVIPGAELMSIRNARQSTSAFRTSTIACG